jgi:hypothetical protein
MPAPIRILTTEQLMNLPEPSLWWYPSPSYDQWWRDWDSGERRSCWEGPRPRPEGWVTRSEQTGSTAPPVYPTQQYRPLSGVPGHLWECTNIFKVPSGQIGMRVVPLDRPELWTLIKYSRSKIKKLKTYSSWYAYPMVPLSCRTVLLRSHTYKQANF